MRRIPLPCCACAASGRAAAAPPSSVMNERRFTSRSLRTSDRKDSTPSTAGDRCAAGFQSELRLLGVKMRRTHIEHMSAGLPLKPDIVWRGWHGRKVPSTAVSRCSNIAKPAFQGRVGRVCSTDRTSLELSGSIAVASATALSGPSRSRWLRSSRSGRCRCGRSTSPCGRERSR